MRLKVSDASVPPGNYTAQFSNLETTQHKEYGDGLCWKFRISQGPQTGKTALRFTGRTASPNSACGRIVAGLLGRPLEPDEEIDVDSYVGKTYLIVVEQAQNGMTRVEAVTPITTADNGLSATGSLSDSTTAVQEHHRHDGSDNSPRRTGSSAGSPGIRAPGMEGLSPP